MSGIMSPEPTARQSEILDYMVEHQRTHGRPATIREIGQRFGITSPNGVSCHLHSLIRRGLVRRTGVKTSRGYAPVKVPLTVAVDGDEIVLPGGVRLNVVDAEVFAEELRCVCQRMRMGMSGR